MFTRRRNSCRNASSMLAVATENILKIAVMKKTVPCSVFKTLTKYQQTNSIFANNILDFGRLTIQNSSSK